jgi:hypothetical protein
MWTVLAIVSLMFAAAVIVWRLATVGRPVPDDNDPSRQHEVPGADEPPPPPT